MREDYERWKSEKKGREKKKKLNFFQYFLLPKFVGQFWGVRRACCVYNKKLSGIHDKFVINKQN